MMEIGSICNNASLGRRENGKFVGQSTDVALLEVLDVFGLEDARRVSFFCRLNGISVQID
jgi:P-type Ca2+ transporter type 2C